LRRKRNLSANALTPVGFFTRQAAAALKTCRGRMRPYWVNYLSCARIIRICSYLSG
jgi:hypothetical protein